MAQEFPYIAGNAIVYQDHVVVCDPSVVFDGYLEDMKNSLSIDGGIATHRRELFWMNNDGSWRIHRDLSVPFPTNKG